MDYSVFKNFTTFLMFFGVIAAGGCTRQSEEQRLSRNLAAHLEVTKTAQANAFEHWDQLAAGIALSCQVGLAVPPYFDLSLAQSNRYPLAAQLRDHLNYAVTRLAESARLWDDLCSNDDQGVPPVIVNQAYAMLQEAKTALAQAEQIQTVWQP